MALPSASLSWLGRWQDTNTRLLLLACCLGLGVPVTTALHLYSLVWQPREAFISPPYGPGLVRAGELSEDTALEFAAEWFQLRYTWRPEIYQLRLEEVLRRTHQHYIQMVKTEMERDAALVNSGKLTSVLLVTEKALVKRLSPVLVRVRLTGYHMLYQGSEVLPESLVTMDVLVLAEGMGTAKMGLTTANTTGLPPLSGKPAAKGKS